MNRNLFGHKPDENSSVKLKLFCDESCSKDWLYLGVLIVPKEIEAALLQDLMNKRCGNPAGNKKWGRCSQECIRHKHNNTEVHYVKVEKSKDKYFVAEKWIDYLLKDTEKIYFYVQGLDLKKLDKSQFGSQRQQNNIYNRFFRTAILKSVKSYFHRYRTIAIERIYHDNNRALESDFYFPWHSIFYIGSKDDKVNFTNKKIEFINSDHRKSKNPYSNFIQFVDLLLGCVNNCLDHTSRNADKEALAEKALPLISRLIVKPNNRNSQYKYVGRQKIEFFPKHDLRNLDENSLEYRYKKMDAFYTKRQLKIRNKNQTSLPL
ncbi:MAG: DUF3800 domain-containing protein [Thermodesulfovibrionia bacterium]|nr:DUF3800 domain-containing protein [Thermodesulfovibrionia bacterium]